MITNISTTTNNYCFNKIDKLGNGAYGIVFKGTKQPLPLPDLSNLDKKRKFEEMNSTPSPIALKCFKNEYDFTLELTFIKILTEKKVPHSIFYRDNKKPYIVMDYVPEKTLDKITKALKWTDILSITKQYLEFLQGTEKLGIFHGDLKPSNTIYEMNSQYLTILDYGVSCHCSEVINEVPYRIRQTVEYRAPEIILKMPPTPESDIWSLGCIVYKVVACKNLSAPCVDYASVEKKHFFRERNALLERIGSQFGTPSSIFCKKFDTSKHFPWNAKKHFVYPKNVKAPVPDTSWKETFRQCAEKKGAPKNDIEFFISFLEKIFVYENRPSASSLLAEFEKNIAFDVKFHFLNVKKNQELTILSDKISIIFDNSLRVNRTCFHIPKNSSNTYLISLKEDRKIIFPDFKVVMSSSSCTLDVDTMIIN